MSDIAFITPNFGGHLKEEPLGTMILATILDQAGLPVEILQFHDFSQDSFEAFLRSAVDSVLAKPRRIVSFYTRCDTFHLSMRIAEEVKKAVPEIYIVFGGPQSDICAEDTLNAAPYVDFICRGEGETTVLPFFTSLLKKSPALDIAGLAYRKEGEIILNPKPELIADLDEIPPINYNITKYRNYNGEDHTDSFPIDVGRGCPFACTYCSTKSFWQRKFRLKSAEWIIDEIKRMHDLFGITTFGFKHDMFTVDRKKVLQVCQAIKELDFKVAWGCNSRMDCLDIDLIREMRDAGMRRLYVGIETGSPRMQKLIKKNLKLDTVTSFIRQITEEGVSVCASFMYGFPEETPEDISLTLAMYLELLSIKNVDLQAHLLAFFQGTELTQRYWDQLKPAKKLSDATGNFWVKENEALISAHPSLFTQYLEYSTPLRERLAYLGLFLQIFENKRTAYFYLAKKYSKENIIEMYDQWVEANREHLGRYDKDHETIALLELLYCEDRFPALFSDDPNYATLQELQRYQATEFRVKKGFSPVEIYQFSVDDFKAGIALEALRPGISVIYRTMQPDGSIKYTQKISRL